MIKNIAAFGDSWIYGDEIEHPDPNATDKQKREYREEHCIVGQLGKQLGLTVENYGISGSSLQVSTWEFHRWLNDTHKSSAATLQETLLVVGLTSANRRSWYNHGNYIHIQGIGTDLKYWPKPWHETLRFTMANDIYNEVDKLLYWQTTEFFYNWAKVNNVKLLMFDVFRPPYWSDLISSPRNEWCAMQELHGTNYMAPGQHPNEAGCKHIAKILKEIL